MMVKSLSLGRYFEFWLGGDGKKVMTQKTTFDLPNIKSGLKHATANVRTPPKARDNRPKPFQQLNQSLYCAFR